ncbi:MAG TPA: glycine zipper domain-containing protein [Chitinophagaceae bacterium]
MKKAAIRTSSFINSPYPVLLFILCLAGTVAFGQDASATTSLNKKLGLYIFPAKDQTPEQQQKDESYCYDWAIKNSGVDPMNMQVAKPDSNAVTGREGEVLVGGAKGAAAGVAIGAIAGDAGKGAAIGAVVGGLAGRGARKEKQAQQKQQAQKKADSANQSQIDAFTKAYKACLTGKGYTVQ